MVDELKEGLRAPRIEREWTQEEHESGTLPDALEDERLTQEMESLRQSAALPSSAPMATKDDVLLSVETLLSENLGDLYLSLPENERQLFKTKGEETAVAIYQMIQSGKFVIEKIMDLIRGWLRIVTGINIYYVEQEVKIKADKIADFVNARVATTL